MIQTYRNHTPRIDATCFVADNATIIGDVTMKADASVWFGSVIRGDKIILKSVKVVTFKIIVRYIPIHSMY